MTSSVDWSTAAVASSMIIIFVFLKRARAKHNSCLCPALIGKQTIKICLNPRWIGCKLQLAISAFAIYATDAMKC